MTIPKITPYSGGVANPDGSQTQTEFTQNMFDQLSYEAQLATQLDATIDGMNNAVDEVGSNAVSAENSANAAEAAASSAGYQGLWPDAGGSANKGDTYQTQVGGVETGDYYTALKNTSVDPVDDNVNWKVDITKKSFGKYTDLTFDSVADAVAATGANGYPNGTKLTVMDYYGGANPNNSGVLFFKVVAGGTGTADGGKYIDAGSLQLEQNLKKPYDVKAWGAKGDGIADDTLAIQSCLDTRGDVDITQGVYSVTGINLRPQQNIRCHADSKLIPRANNIAVISAGVNPAWEGVYGTLLDGCTIDLSGYTGCTGVLCDNFRERSGVNRLRVLGDGTNSGNVGINLRTLCWNTQVSYSYFRNIQTGIRFGNSTNTCVLQQCSVDYADVGLSIEGGTVVGEVIDSNVIVGGFYQNCRIGIRDYRGRGNSYHNPYFELCSEVDLDFDTANMPKVFGSHHPSQTNIAIRGRDTIGARLYGVDCFTANTRILDWDATNSYCEIDIQQTATFGNLDSSVLTGLKTKFNMPSATIWGDIGIQDGRFVGAQGATRQDINTASLSNGYDLSREPVGNSIVVNTGERLHRVTIDTDKALIANRIPDDGRNFTLVITSSTSSLTVTFQGLPIDWSSKPSGTRRTLVDCVYVDGEWTIGGVNWC